jgi:hypothetical protein
VSESINRADVLFESHPGVTNEIEREVEARGGWVCEKHPHLPWPHGDCGGPGMPADEAPTTADGQYSEPARRAA